MKYKAIIRKIIREEINYLFEFMGFQIDSSEQMETSKALHTLPRKGIDDDINNINLIDFEQNQKNKKEKEYSETDKFTVPSLNNGVATTLTNIYEDATVNKDSQAAMFNLDKEKKNFAKYGFLNTETQEAVDDYNDNINKELNKIIYVGDSNMQKPSSNSFGISK